MGVCILGCIHGCLPVHYVYMFVFVGVPVSPALLQSTLKLFFWPTRALDSPGPRHTTLLASEDSLTEVEAEEAEEEEELKAPPTLEVLVTVSTRTEEVSWRLWPPDKRTPERERDKEGARLSNAMVAQTRYYITHSKADTDTSEAQEDAQAQGRVQNNVL